MDLVKINNLRSLLPLLKQGHPLNKEVNDFLEVCDMSLGEGGFVAAGALYCVVKGQNVEWYINPHCCFLGTRGVSMIVRVERNYEGSYEAIIPSTDGWGHPFTYKWEPRDEPRLDWFPISVSRFA